MIKFTIGRSPENRYVIHDPNQVISNHHATISQYPDGKITITDTSSNGTTLNGAKLPKNQEIAIRRGDNIVFADLAPMEWARIPSINFPNNISNTITIGRSADNNYVTKSNDTGRNHACLVITNDKKYYILDQSKNGITVKGERIPVYQFKPTNRGQKIKLGNSELLDWSRIPGPGLPPGVIKTIYVIFTIAGLGLLLYTFKDRIFPPPPPPPIATPESRKTAIVMVYNKFYYTYVDSKNNTTSYYGRGGHTMNKGDLNQITPFEILGTGFFISNDGKFITNKHVAEPWLSDEYKKILIPVNDSWVSLVQSGISIELGIVPNGQMVNKNNFNSSLIKCDINTVKSHPDQNVDLALIQVQGKSLPPGATFIPTSDLMKRDEINTTIPGQDQVVILGYPFALNNWWSEKPTIELTYDAGTISRIDNPYYIHYNANTAKGASGSPVIHLKSGKIIGVNSMTREGAHNIGMQADYIFQLFY